MACVLSRVQFKLYGAGRSRTPAILTEVFVVFLSLPRQMPGQNLYQVMAATFQILYNSLLTYCPTIRRYIVWDTDSTVKKKPVA
jgi:hypothetical protein